MRTVKLINPQLTLGIIKPDASQTPHVMQKLTSMVDNENLGVVKHKIVKLKVEEAENFYIEHKPKFFYNRLITFMISGPLHVFILAHENAITRWRQLMGPTKVFRAQLESPKTIRGMLGLTDTRNTTHGSDSPESALKEISFFFPEFSLEEWKQRGCPVSTLSDSLGRLRKHYEQSS